MDGLGALKVEGVAGTAVYSLLVLGNKSHIRYSREGTERDLPRPHIAKHNKKIGNAKYIELFNKRCNKIPDEKADREGGGRVLPIFLQVILHYKTMLTELDQTYFDGRRATLTRFE